MVNYNVMERRHQRLLLLVSITLFVTIIDSATALAHLKSNEHESSPIEGASLAAGRCGCMIGPAGPPGIPGVPGLHGNRGHDGSKGDQGTNGQKGETGAPGVAGPMGERGRRGSRGQPGIKGDAGDLGPPGLKGQKGEPSLSSTTTPRRSPAARVAFSVARSQKLGPVLEDTLVRFDVVYTNVGDGFDLSASRFVCRTNGTYTFTAHLLGQNNKDVYAWIMMNDKHKVPIHGDGRAGYGTGSQTLVLSMKTDDFVWIQLSKDSALLNDYTTFSGYLVFDD